jgi:carbon monoxide dehydrogenase subunit G
MVRFAGDREFALSPAEAHARLTDLSFLVGCIPDVETVRAIDADRAELVLRPGFSFVRGTLDVTLRLVERDAPNATFHLLSKGIGSSSEVQATLAVSENGAGSRVHWVAEVTSLGGLLKMVPAGLIRGAAEKVINDAWDRIGRAMGGNEGVL